MYLAYKGQDITSNNWQLIILKASGIYWKTFIYSACKFKKNVFASSEVAIFYFDLANRWNKLLIFLQW